MPFITPIHARQSSQILQIPPASKIAIIGTSLTDNGYRDESESSAIRGYSARGAFSWVRVLTNQQFDFYNRGNGGDTIDDLITRYDSDVTPLSPTHVFFETGTNDSSKTVADYKIKLAQLYAKANSHGAIAIPLTIPMRSLPVSQSVIDKYLEVNEWILENYPNAIEINKYFSDPATNRPLSDYTEDGVHYTNIGAHAIARSIIESINATGNRDTISTAQTPNPTLTGTSGTKDSGVIGTMPNDYHFDILSGTSTVTLTANDPSLSILFEPNGGTGVDTYRIRGDNIAANPTKFYEFIAKIKLSHWEGWNYIQLRMNKTGGSQTLYSYDLRQEAEGFPWPPNGLAIEKLLRTETISGTNGTSVTPYIEIGIHADAVGSGRMDISLWQVQLVE